MDHQQFKIRMSVSTKLLLIIGVLTAAPIFFLNVSAITLFTGDKKAYIYDSQATQAVLAGREFVSFLESALGSLKVMVGSVDDPTKTPSETTRKNLDFYLANQQVMLGAELRVLDLQKGGITVAYRHLLPDSEQARGLKLDTNAPLLEGADLGQVYRAVGERGYAFKNISRAGLPPMLAVFFGAMKATSTGNRVVLAAGFINLAHFVSDDVTHNRFVIADRAGSMLFNSEAKLLYANLSLKSEPIFQDAWSGGVKSAAKEYISAEGVRLLGSYYKPGLDLVAMSQIEYDKAMQATYALTEKFVILAIGAFAIMVVIGLVFSRSLTTPLNRLFSATAQVSSGDFNVSLPVTTRDEIGALTTSFVAMSRRIQELLREMVDRVRVDQEVEIARTVQQALFPPNSIGNEQVDVATAYQSASECGGDWLGYFRAGNKHTFVIADATGHGLPSALITASARSCFSVIEKLANENRFNLDPSDMLSAANRVVYDGAQGKIMMTCFVCVLDFEARTLSYASAAHNPPWLFGAKPEGGQSLQSLVAKGPRLGEAQELTEPYEVRNVPFNLGDTLVLYTDGLLEGKNPDGGQYGKKRARGVLEGVVAGSPQSIIRALLEDFARHNTDKALDDDVTLAVARVLA